MPYKYIILLLATAAALAVKGQKKSKVPCNGNLRPIVFVHGFLASGDTWAAQVQRFSGNGYCENRLFAFDWNTIGGKQKSDSLLAVFITAVLAKTGATQVDLVGHSAGGGLCYACLKDSINAAKVAHYVHIGSNKMKGAAGPSGNIPTLNIYSTDDKVVRSSGDIPGAKNVQLTGYDHLQVATSGTSFAAMYPFFTGHTGKLNAIVPAPKQYRKAGGKGVLLGENTPLAFDSFRVFAFDPVKGVRYTMTGNKTRPADGSYTGWTKFDKDGNWQFSVTAGLAMEFEARPKHGRPVFYFFEPLQRNNPLIYIRALPSQGMVAGMLRDIPNDDAQVALVIFTANQAVISGRDTLAIDSIPLSLPNLTPAGKTAIASFVFDDGDDKTSGKPLKSFSSAPFLSGVDVFIPAGGAKPMRIYYNGRSMTVPRRSSKEGITVVVFN